MDAARCAEQASAYPLPPDAPPFDYGTAGFRTHASRLLPVAFRCGALAAARSFARGGAATGVVVTARLRPLPPGERAHPRRRPITRRRITG